MLLCLVKKRTNKKFNHKRQEIKFNKNNNFPVTQLKNYQIIFTILQIVL